MRRQGSQQHAGRDLYAETKRVVIKVERREHLKERSHAHIRSDGAFREIDIWC